MASYDYDVIVIGSGASGLVAARLLAKGGKTVAVVENSKVGGTCPHEACIPTKALLESAHLYHHAKHAEGMGLRSSLLSFNYPRIRAWKNVAIKKTRVGDTETSLIAAGINVIHGSAHFINSETITVGRARFSARSYIIASGATPIRPAIPGLSSSDTLTYPEALELSRPPRSIAIVGGGAVGVEFASIFGSFGSKVYLLEKGAHLLPHEEAEVGKILAENLRKRYGVITVTRAHLQTGARRGYKKQLIIKAAGKLHAIVVDDILFTVGKAPNTDIGLENANVQYTPQGILVDAQLKTTAKHIFAVGDVLGGPQSTHLASYQGRIAAHNLLHPKKRVSVDYRAIPRTVFSSPEAAMVGLSSEEIKAERIKTLSAQVPLSAVSRSYLAPEESGFVKLAADKHTGKLVSASIVAPHASEIIHELTLAINNGLRAEDVAKTQHAFPTWSEAVRLAATKLSKNI